MLPTEVVVSSIPSPSSSVSLMSLPYAAYRNRRPIFEMTHHTPNSQIIHPTIKDSSPITQPPFSNSNTGSQQSNMITQEEDEHQHPIEDRGSNNLHQNTNYNCTSTTSDEYRAVATTPPGKPYHSRPSSAPPRQQYGTPIADFKNPASPLMVLQMSTERGGGLPKIIDNPPENRQYGTISCKIRRQNPDHKQEYLRQGRRIRHSYVNSPQKGKYCSFLIFSRSHLISMYCSLFDNA